MTHICVGMLTIIGSNNGLSPSRRQAIIWTNARILLTGPLGTNFNEILIEIHTFSFKKIHLKMSSVKRRLFRFGLNVLILIVPIYAKELDYNPSHGEQYTMTSSNGNIFCVTGPLWRESTWQSPVYPLTKVNDAELWCFLWSSEKKRLIETPVIWDTTALIMTLL